MMLCTKKYLGPSDRVLIIDDFLANGCAVNGLIEIINEAEAPPLPEVSVS